MATTNKNISASLPTVPYSIYSPSEKILPVRPRRKLKPKKKIVRTDIKRVAPTIVKKPSPSEILKAEVFVPVDTTKTVAFAMSIAREMKIKARLEAEAEKKAQEEAKEINGIKLTKRPVTRTRGEETAHFQQADLEEFRKRLIVARENARKGAFAIRATGFNEAEDHEADGGDGTNQTLRLQALGQIGNINRTLQQIEEALHRIDDGTYGVCTACGQLIRKPRLLNQPFVLTCMECQNEMEHADK